jgi:hypothetical protein
MGAESFEICFKILCRNLTGGTRKGNKNCVEMPLLGTPKVATRTGNITSRISQALLFVPVSVVDESFI